MAFRYKIKKIPILKNSFIIENSSFKDLRGNIFTIFNKEMQKKLIKKNFDQYHDKLMVRKKNTLTGIHGDNKTWKVLTCLHGKILLILVDCDKKSKNFGKYFKIILNSDNPKSVLISPKIGNSYLCLDKKNIIYYKIFHNGKYNDFDKQFTYKWNDSKFNISWPIKNPILSTRDK
jgi:dTDP-4-dehydrorhamnose 3,5-epimerase